MWLYVDYYELNEIIIKNHYSLSHINEFLNRLNEINIFIKLDLRDVYHRIRIRRENEWKTTFRTRYDHFEYLIMLFELCNVSVTFQVYINQTMREILNINCIVYLDNILIFLKNEKKHEKHVKKILRWLKRYSLFVKLFKCEFHKSKMKFLDYIVRKVDVWMNFSKMNIIQD